MTDHAPAAERPPLPPSPCVGICTLQGPHCYGCGRTADEIAAWGSLSPDAQSAVWALLPGRLAAFGFRTFRLAAGPKVISDFIGRTFRETTGRWRVVSPMIEGSLEITGEARPQFTEDLLELTAISETGSVLTITKQERMRAFGFAIGEGTTTMDTVVLVLPKGLAHRIVQAQQESPSSNSEGYTDLGLPNLYASAAVSTWNHEPSAAVHHLEGLDWTETRRRLPGILAEMTATLVIRNAIGTIKTYTPTFHDADFLDAGPGPDANAPPDVKISKAFVACVIFHCDDPDWLAAALAP